MAGTHSRVAIVGAGFGGIGASVVLGRAGVEHVVLERTDELGGTWRDNRYPGCRCDVPSHLYSFSFAPNPEWSETYSTQWEIQEYLRRTAKDFGVHRRFPAAQRFVRGYTSWLRELLFAPALLKNDKGLDRLERMIRRSVERQVRDPELLAKLLPDYRPGCKRLLPSNDWYPAIQQPNVDLVTEKILEIRPNAIVTVDGSEIPVDAIVLATGFHVTDNPVLGRVRGRDGRSLLEHWAGTGMRAYLGTTVPGFPNMFLLAGPNTGIGHTSLVYVIEAQLAYVADAITRMRARGVASFDVREDVAEHFNEEVQRKAAHTVWNTGGCASWYLDAEGRNTTLWPDQSYRFRRRTRRFDPRSYSFKR